MAALNPDHAVVPLTPSQITLLAANDMADQLLTLTDTKFEALAANVADANDRSSLLLMDLLSARMAIDSARRQRAADAQ